MTIPQFCLSAMGVAIIGVLSVARPFSQPQQQSTHAATNRLAAIQSLTNPPTTQTWAQRLLVVGQYIDVKRVVGGCVLEFYSIDVGCRLVGIDEHGLTTETTWHHHPKVRSFIPLEQVRMVTFTVCQPYTWSHERPISDSLHAAILDHLVLARSVPDNGTYDLVFYKGDRPDMPLWSAGQVIYSDHDCFITDCRGFEDNPFLQSTYYLFVRTAIGQVALTDSATMQLSQWAGSTQ